MKQLLALCIVLPILSRAQNGLPQIGIRPPVTPQFHTFQPIDISRPSTLNNGLGQRQPTITPPVPLAGTVPLFGQGGNQPMGATADDIIRQTQENAIRVMGATTPEQAAWLEAERDRDYKAMVAELNADAQIHYANMQGRHNPELTKDPVKAKANFVAALQQLKAIMASNKPSVANAFYITENAFGRPWLTKTEYNSILDNSASFIKTWLVQNGYKLNDNEALHFGIQKFMSEKLTIKQGQRTITHQPFFYDYQDFTGEKDYRNTFMTKCLATGTGQCAGMPQVYLALAERLGATAYLTFAPNHSFVKYVDNKGHIQNYEPTSNWNISDKWYQDNMFISQQAVRSGIYLNMIDTKQVVANCMIDLATEYIRTMPFDDGSFLKECVNTAMLYYPKWNNIFGYFILSTYHKCQLRNYLVQHHIANGHDLANYPDAMKLQAAIDQNEAAIKGLGYTKQPLSLYESIMQEHEFKGKVQAGQNVPTKEKHSLFTNQ